jgi:hypothetical protein
LSEQEEQIMPQTRTISLFLAAMPGVNDRTLRDIGLDADGYFLDEDDPRVPRRAIKRPFVARMLGLLSLRGATLPDLLRVGSRL